MNPELENALERLDEESNRADKLTEERDCAREALAESQKTIATLHSCLWHIKQLALETRDRPDIALSAAGLSAIGGLAIAQAALGFIRNDVPCNVPEPVPDSGGHPGHQNAS